MTCQRLFDQFEEEPAQEPHSERDSVSLHPGFLHIGQPPGGYHFTSDSVALAEFIRIAPHESLLDLGTGVAVVPLQVWNRTAFRLAVGVELQPELAQYARKNVNRNCLADRVFIIEQDVNDLTTADFACLPCDSALQKFEVISANPPYHPVANGRLNLHPQKAIARHEVRLTFRQLIQTCLRFLTIEGRLYLVNLEERRAELVRDLKGAGFELTREQQAPRSKGRILLEFSRPRQ